MNNQPINEASAGFEPIAAREEFVRAIQTKDESYLGVIYVGVTSTRIFCRPGCPARAPLPKHMVFFSSCRAALTHGFRPCRRCDPMAATTNPAWLAPLLNTLESEPGRRTSDHLIRDLGVEPSRVRRFFQAKYGMTFHAFARSQRLTRALTLLKDGASVDDSGYATGFESASGFRDAFQKQFGMPPQAQNGKSVIMVTLLESPVGPLIAGIIDGKLCLLEFAQRRMLDTQLALIRRHYHAPFGIGTSAMFDQIREELRGYFSGTLRTFSTPLEARGTPFQERVWQALLEIPYGVTCSYEDIARAVGSPKGVRAVGTANGCNRIAIVIPCHRVVNKNGELGGYGGGLWRKKALLALEKGELDLPLFPAVGNGRASADSEKLTKKK